VIGGMLAEPFIATLFVPVFFRWIAAWGQKRPAPSEAAPTESTAA
jgi:ribose/xylose/arabinose/galactoside ABC-type transport system permease subunit